MNRLYKKLIPLSISVFAMTTGFAQPIDHSESEMKTKETTQYRECDRCAPAEVCQPCPCETITEDPLMCAYNAPVNTMIKCPMDVFVTASFIYWQAKEKGLELGITANTETADNGCDPCKTGSVINMDFDFKPGFKVGLGMHSDYDNWHLYLEYTRLHLTDHKTYKLNDDCACNDDCDPFPPCTEILPVRIAEDLYLNVAKGKWTMNLDVLDLELGRAYWVGTELTFAPFVGLRGGWLDQKMRAKYCGRVDDEGCAVPSCISYITTNKSDSWLIGPRVGIDTNWHVWEGFRLFGNTAFSLFYQRFRRKGKRILN